MPNLGLIGAGGAAAGGTALQQLLKQRLVEEMQRGQLDLENRRLGEDTRQFDRTAGQRDQDFGLRDRGFSQEVREYDEAAPTRAATLTGLNLRNDAGAYGLDRERLKDTRFDTARETMAGRAPDTALDPVTITDLNIGGGPDFTSAGGRASLFSPRALGTQEGQATGAAWDTSGRRIAAEEARIIAQNRPPPSEPLVSVVGPDGAATLVPRSQAAGMSPTTSRKPVLGAERTALSYFNRAKEADAITTELEPQIADMGLAGQAGLEYLPNVLQSDLGQSYRQAQRAFTEARLRKESGAAIPQGEYDTDAKTYFAQPGDAPSTIAQKRQARQEVLDGLGFSSGAAYQEFYGSPFERQAPKHKPDTPRGPLKPISESDIAEAMRARGWTREQAIAEARSRGYAPIR